MRCLGTIALETCMVGSGRGILLLHPMEWLKVCDVAGALVFLTESGGVAKDINGRELGRLSLDLELRLSAIASTHTDVQEEVLALWRSGE